MSEEIDLSKLRGKSLDEFTIQIVYEVFRIFEDPKIDNKILRYFESYDVASAFSKQQKYPTQCHVKERLMLLKNHTGTGFLIGEQITVGNSHKAHAEVRKLILKKLTKEERSVLGL